MAAAIALVEAREIRLCVDPFSITSDTIGRSSNEDSLGSWVLILLLDGVSPSGPKNGVGVCVVGREMGRRRPHSILDSGSRHPWLSSHIW